MNPGVAALERLVEETGLFCKGQLPGSPKVQYFPSPNHRPVTPNVWANAAGLVHVASSWVGSRGLSVMRGRLADDVVYVYDPREDR